MAADFILLHIIPLDGKFFDDPEQAIFSLVILNLVVFALIIIALISVKEGRKKAAREEKARRKALKESQPVELVAVSKSSSTASPKKVSKSARSGKANHTSRPLVTSTIGYTQNYTRPTKK